MTNGDDTEQAVALELGGAAVGDRCAFLVILDMDDSRAPADSVLKFGQLVQPRACVRLFRYTAIAVQPDAEADHIQVRRA